MIRMGSLMFVEYYRNLSVRQLYIMQLPHMARVQGHKRYVVFIGNNDCKVALVDCGQFRCVYIAYAPFLSKYRSRASSNMLCTSFAAVLAKYL